MADKNIMTKNDLTWLDDYGHRRLEELTEMQLNEYATLLQMRRQAVLKQILERRKVKVY